MAASIVIIDYGVGNLRSVEKALQRVGAGVRVSDDPASLREAAGIVFPGVGAFGDAMDNFRAAGFEPVLREQIAAGKPLLGICVGMQMLFDVSEEMGQHQGLAIFPGRVRRFPDDVRSVPDDVRSIPGSPVRSVPGSPVRSIPRSLLKVPHMGWNQIHIRRPHPLLDGVADGSYVYFVHSYYPEPADPGIILAETDYGVDFASIVGRDNVYGIQFHPEKSQSVGLRILRNFVRMVSGR